MSRANAPFVALLASLVAGCGAHAMVAPLDYGPPRLAREEAFRAAPPDAAPVIPRIPIALREARLPSGLRVIHVERRALPVITVRLVLDRGIVDLGGDEDAYAILRRLVDGGTEERKGPDLADAWAKLGAAHGVAFGPDGAALWAKVESSDLDAAVALLAEMATRPRLVERSVAGARAAWIGDVMNGRFAVGPTFARNTAALLFGAHHPYGYLRRDPRQTEALGQAHFTALHARLFRPEHAALIVVGDASAEAVDAVAARHLGAWTTRGTPLSRVGAPPPPIEGPRVVHCANENLAETNVQIVARGPAPGDPDLLVLELCARALGGLSSRLRGDMREERGVAYSFGADVSPMRLASTLHLGGSLAAARALPAVRAMLDALDEAGDKGLAEAEIDRARTSLISAWRGAVSTSDGLAAILAGQVITGQPIAEIAAVPERLGAITGDDVRRVARRYLGRDARRLVVLGHRSLGGDLAALGLGPVVRRDSWASVVR